MWWRFSDPSFTGVVWEKATSEYPSRHLRYRPNPRVMNDLFSDSAYQFWNSLEVYDYNVITGERRPKTDDGSSNMRLLTALYITGLLLYLHLSLRDFLPFWRNERVSIEKKKMTFLLFRIIARKLIKNFRIKFVIFFILICLFLCFFFYFFPLLQHKYKFYKFVQCFKINFILWCTSSNVNYKPVTQKLTI